MEGINAFQKSDDVKEDNDIKKQNLFRRLWVKLYNLVDK